MHLVLLLRTQAYLAINANGAQPATGSGSANGPASAAVQKPVNTGDVAKLRALHNYSDRSMRSLNCDSVREELTK